MSNFLSFYTLTDIFFVKGFCGTLQARVVIYGMQIDDDVLYHGIANQPSAAYSSQYLFNFLLLHTLNDEISVKGFCRTLQAREVIFGMQVDDNCLYCGIANQLFAYSSLYLSDFLSSHTLNNDFCQRFL